MPMQRAPLSTVAGGGMHTLAAVDTKKLLSFGSGSHGQLGSGAAVDRCVPGGVDPSGEDRDSVLWNHIDGNAFVHVACGNSHSATLTESGRLFLWGRNHKQQLGLEPHELEATSAEMTRKEWTPCMVRLNASGTMRRVAFVSCGVNFTVAVAEDGAAYSWGSGNFGNLGHGDVAGRDAPTRIDALREVHIFMVAAGTKHVLAAARGGDLYSWGFGGNGRLGLGEVRGMGSTMNRGQPLPSIVFGIEQGVDYVAAGEGHSAAISRDGELFMWGSGSYGRLGLGYELDVQTPLVVDALPPGITAVACGVFHTLALTENGALFSFGGGEHGQLGLGDDRSNHALPEELQKVVHSFRSYRVLEIACGDFHSACIAVNRDVGPGGLLMTWGFGVAGRLGQGAAHLECCTRPQALSGISVAQSHLKSGAMRLEVGASRLARLRLAAQNSVRVVSCGSAHSAAITTNGQLYMWGANQFGQLGDGSSPHSTATPKLSRSRTQIVALVKRVACGLNHTVVLTQQGLVYAWGCGAEGQLGVTSVGFAEVNHAPLRIVAFDEAAHVVGVYASESSSAAVTSLGALFTWGNNDFGKLGHGHQHSAPALARQVGGLLADEQVKMCALAPNHTVALTDDGTVYTWGEGWFGRLGTGLTANFCEPQMVRGAIEGLRCDHVAAGAYHTMAVCMGDLYVWGRNDLRLGIGENPSQLLSPHRNDALWADGKNVVVCSASRNHSIAICDDGTVWSWGSGAFCKLSHENRARAVTEGAPTGASAISITAPQQADVSVPGRVVLFVETGHRASMRDIFARVPKSGAGLDLGAGHAQVGPQALDEIRTVAVQENHCIALSACGEVYVWGSASTGRLGLTGAEDVDGHAIQPQATRLSHAQWFAKPRAPPAPELQAADVSASDAASAGATDQQVTATGLSPDSTLRDVLAHVQQLLKQEPPGHSISRLMQQQDLNIEQLDALVSNFNMVVLPQRRQCIEVSRRISILLERTLQTMYPPQDEPMHPDQPTARLLKTRRLLAHIINVMSMHPLVLDEMHERIFGQSNVRLAVSEPGRVQTSSSGITKLRNYEKFTDLVVVVFGNLTDMHMENLFLRTLQMILRREMNAFAATDADTLVKSFGDKNSVFGRLVHVYFRSRLIMRPLALEMSEPLKEFLSNEKMNLDINPNAVRVDVRAAGALDERHAMSLRSSPEAEEINRRVTMLVEQSSKWLIMLLVTLTSAPRGVRFVCQCIRKAVRESFGGQQTKDGVGMDALARELVGKFIVLHYFRPAVQFPKRLGVLPGSWVVSDNHRTNLNLMMQVVYRCLTNSMYTVTTSTWYMQRLNDCIEHNREKCKSALDELIDLPSDHLDRCLMKDMLGIHLRTVPLTTQATVTTLRFLVAVLRELAPKLKKHVMLSSLIAKLSVPHPGPNWCEGDESGNTINTVTGDEPERAHLVSTINLELDHTFGEPPIARPVVCPRSGVPLPNVLRSPGAMPLALVSPEDLRWSDMHGVAFKQVLIGMEDFTVIDAGVTLDANTLMAMMVARLNNLKDAHDFDGAEATHAALVKLRAVRSDQNGTRALIMRLLHFINIRSRAYTSQQMQVKNIEDLRQAARACSAILVQRRTALTAYFNLVTNGLAGENNRILARAVAAQYGVRLSTNSIARDALVKKTDKYVLKLAQKQLLKGIHGTYKFTELVVGESVAGRPSPGVILAFQWQRLTEDKTMKSVAFAKFVDYTFSSIASGVYHVTATYKKTLVIDSFNIDVAMLDDMSLRFEESFTPASTNPIPKFPLAKTTFNTQALSTFIHEELLFKELSFKIAADPRKMTREDKQQ